MATLPLKSSRNEQRAVIRFLWVKGLNANEIHSEMRPVYGDKCFVWGEMKKVLGGQKFASDTELQSVVRQWLGQQPAAFFASAIQ